MQVVAVDVGNSSIKYIAGELSGDGNRYEWSWPDCRSISLTDWHEDKPPVDGKAHWFVSSVNDEHRQRMKTWCEKCGSVESWNIVDRDKIPLAIDLDSPESVGIDRLLAGFAAWQLHGQKSNTIVIDCGTALTIDFVSHEGIFRGGVIIAGPATNLLALSSMTEALPDLSATHLSRPESVIGRSTSEAMLNGAWYNGLGAIREVVAEMIRTCDDAPVVVGTGGGLGPWRDVLPGNWVLVNELVLDGIFLIASRLNAATRSTHESH